MPTLKELQEKKNQLATQIRSLADAHKAAGDKWETPEKRSEWEKVNGDYDATLTSLKADEDKLSVDARRQEIEEDAKRTNNPRGIGREDRTGKELGGERTTVTEEHRTLAFQGWMRRQMGEELTKRQREACKLTKMNPNRRKIEIPLFDSTRANSLRNEFRAHHPALREERMRESRTMSSITGTTGGYLTAPETLMKTLEINLLAYGGMRQVATPFRTTDGNSVSAPTADDTGNEGYQLGESGSVGSSVDPSLAKVLWNAYKFFSGAVLVPFELLEDTAFDLPSILGAMLGERLGRGTNRKFTLGTGASTAKGIVTAATLGKTCASQTVFTADEVVQLIHSVDPAYRNGAGFMMHDNQILAMRLLKDGIGRPLWQPGYELGVPDRILGYGLTINQHMDGAAVSATKVMLFGLLSKYMIRTVGGVRMYRLQERYRDNDQDGFMAFLREDGNLLDAGTHPVKYMKLA